jgi:hypothetical protein
MAKRKSNKQAAPLVTEGALPVVETPVITDAPEEISAAVEEPKQEKVVAKQVKPIAPVVKPTGFRFVNKSGGKLQIAHATPSVIFNNQEFTVPEHKLSAVVGLPGIIKL